MEIHLAIAEPLKTTDLHLMSGGKVMRTLSLGTTANSNQIHSNLSSSG